jgi:TPR repeat protein
MGKQARQEMQAATQGEAMHQFIPGSKYALGEGVAQDKVQADWLYRQAADQGLAQAQLYLGLCFEDGEGVPQDKAQAARLYRQAAY